MILCRAIMDISHFLCGKIYTDQGGISQTGQMG